LRSELIAKRYANALFELGQEEGKEQGFLQELEGMVKVVEGNDEFRSILESPLYDIFLKKRIMYAVVGEIGFSQYITRFLDILLEKDRFEYLADILKIYMEIMDEASGKVRARITTAMEIGGEDVKGVADTLSRLVKKEVIPEANVDPSLIGGIVAEVQGVVYDGSIKRQIEKIKQNIKG